MLIHGDRRSTMGNPKVVSDDNIAFEPVMHVRSTCARKVIVQMRPFKSWGGRFRLTALAYGMVRLINLA